MLSHCPIVRGLVCVGILSVTAAQIVQSSWWWKKRANCETALKTQQQFAPYLILSWHLVSLDMGNENEVV